MTESRAAWIFVAPALGALAAFLFVPVVASLALSFTDFDLYAVADPANLRFVGADNYRALLADPLFWRALRNTAYFALVGGPLSVAVSLAAALLVNARLTRFRPLFRTLFFLPVVTTLVAVAVVWRFLYHPRIGLVNHVLGLVGVAPVDWLGDPLWAMPASILLAVWKGFGFNMVIFVAGLQGIPEKLYEAARLDGANAWQQLRHVTLPQLAPTAFFVARDDDDRLAAALRRAVRDDTGRAVARDALRRALHVPGRLPLLEHGLRGRGRVRALRDPARRDRAPALAAAAFGVPLMRALRSLVLHAVLIGAAILTVLPLAWMLAASFVPRGASSDLVASLGAGALDARALPHALRRASTSRARSPTARDSPRRRPSSASRRARSPATRSRSCASPAAIARSACCSRRS